MADNDDVLTLERPVSSPLPDQAGVAQGEKQHRRGPQKLALTTTPLDPLYRENLAKFRREAIGAYAPNTLIAWEQDSRAFTEYCLIHEGSSLPAHPDIIAGFIRHLANTKKSASIRRAVATIAKLHEAAGAENPCLHSTVKNAMRSMHRKKGRAQEQVDPLNWEHIDKALNTLSNDKRRNVLDKAMALTAYDGLLRPEELTRIHRDDITINTDGTGLLFIAHSKSDQEAEGAYLFLSRTTVNHLDAWLRVANILVGPVFRPVMKSGKVGDAAITTKGVTRAFKRIALAIGIDSEQISGHSCRVGAAQDLHEAGMSLLEVQTAGRWKSADMPARYTEKIAASRGGMAKLAQQQAR